ncbi:MAG: Ig-like domain-containing protein, partial [Bacteroidaceae bacterium]|nr:Ig-like domain-containing protein [Bacteroidaceae bacterium]
MKRSTHIAHQTTKLHSFIAYCLLFIAHCLLLVSCARIGTPDGGPYDETPPKVVRTSPKYGATNVKDVKKVIIEFDEIIKIDDAM